MATSARRLKPFGRLLWKEAAQVVPLLLALAALSILLHALASMMQQGYVGFSALAVLIPNLFALGAPALLIGQEEESGTLRWTRTLPVDWRYAATAKLLVAAAGLAALWVFSGAVLAIAWRMVGPALPAEWQAGSYRGEIFYALAFSLQLLCCGFAVSWWLRAPIPSLLTLVPVICATTLGSNAAVGYLLRGSWDNRGFDPRSPEMLYGALALLLVSAVLTAIAYAGARNALARPAGAWWPRRSRTLRTTPGVYAYQPPPAVPLLRAEPRLALLWQHARQSAVITVPAAIVGLSSVLIAGLSSDQPAGTAWLPLSIMAAVVSVSMLGCATFLTDNVGGRHRFLAERGIGTWRVWWTRQLLPATLALIVTTMLVVAISNTYDSGNRLQGMWLIAAMAVCAFFTGQLAAQAIARPAVAIMGAPLLLVAAIMATAATFGFYPEFYWTTLLALPFLWLATLGLCRRWLDGRTGAGYHFRMAGWIGAACLTLVVPIVAVRWATMPAAMPEWVAATRAEAAAALEAGQTASYINTVGFREPHLLRHDMNSPPSQPLTDRQLKEIRLLTDAVDDGRAIAVDQRGTDPALLAWVAGRLRYQMQQHANGETEADQRKGEPLRDLYQRLLRSMLLSMQRLRESRAALPLYYSQLADQLEPVVLTELAQDTRSLVGQQAWAELIVLLPSSEQRQHDRRQALLSAWYRFRFGSDEHRAFDHFSFTEPRQVLPLEQRRTNRLIDRATRTSLQQLRDALPSLGSPEYETRIRQWREALWGQTAISSPLGWGVVPTDSWRGEVDRQREQLRVRAGLQP